MTDKEFLEHLNAKLSFKPKSRGFLKYFKRRYKKARLSIDGSIMHVGEKQYWVNIDNDFTLLKSLN